MRHSWGTGRKLQEEPDLSLQRKVHGIGLVLEGRLPVVGCKDWEGCQKDLAGHSLVDWPWGGEDERKKRVTLKELFSGEIEERTEESRVPFVFVLAVTEAERRRRQEGETQVGCGALT